MTKNLDDNIYGGDKIHGYQGIFKLDYQRNGMFVDKKQWMNEN